MTTDLYSAQEDSPNDVFGMIHYRLYHIRIKNVSTKKASTFTADAFSLNKTEIRRYLIVDDAFGSILGGVHLFGEDDRLVRLRKIAPEDPRFAIHRAVVAVGAESV